MSKHHSICKAQKKHRKNRQKHWENIRDGIAKELERKANVRRFKKAQKAVGDTRKKAIENAEKDRIRLAKKESRAKKETRGDKIKQIKKRTTKNGETK